MLKISEFSRLAQVPAATLRYYDQIGLLKPAQVDTHSEYRFYSVEQLPRLNRIAALKDLGFSLDEVARLLDDRVDVRAMLRARLAEAEREARESQARVQRVARRLADLEDAPARAPFDVVLKPAPGVTLASTRVRAASVWQIGEFCNAMHRQLRQLLRKRGVRPAAAPNPSIFNLYHEQEFKETDIDLELAVVIDQPLSAPLVDGALSITSRTLPAEPLMATTLFTGAMHLMEPAVRALLLWAGSNPFSVAGPLRELHYEPADALEDEPNIVELQLPLHPA